MFRNPDLTQISTHDWNNLFIQHMFLCEDWIEISYWVSFVFCLRVLFPSKCSLSSPGPWRHFSNAEGWLEALLLECMLLCLMKLIWLMTGALRGSAGLCPTHCHCSQRGTGCVSSDLLFAVLWACTVLAGAGGGWEFSSVFKGICPGESNL